MYIAIVVGVVGAVLYVVRLKMKERDMKRF